MSGPKVVRIVTREELIAICEGQLARVDAALAEWIRVGRRNDCVEESEIAAARARMDRLRALLRSDRFMDLQKAAPLEVEFLRNDMQTRLAKVADEAEQARAGERRKADAATALLRALQARGRPISADLEARLTAAAGGQADPAALAEGFAALSGPDPAEGEARRSHAARLKENEASRSLADWLAAQPPSPDEEALVRLDRRLAELAGLMEIDQTAQYEERLAAARVAEGPRRHLLLDSLAMDLSRELAVRRKQVELERALKLVLAELSLVSSDSSRVIAERAAAHDVDLVQLLAEAEATLATTRQRAAADHRRRAVLESLAGLGYEVAEGLATAWADRGQVVLRRPAQAGYGVEISGDPASKLQMRVVAFDGVAAADASRDRDAETLWCGDVAALEQDLARRGGGLVIERALAVGAAPVKRVAAVSVEAEHLAREGPSVQTKAQPPPGGA